MISAEKLEKTAETLFGHPLELDFRQLADMLNNQACGMQVSEYGYFMWLVDQHGTRAVFKNIIMSPKSVEGYVSDAVQLMNQMPEMLLNAHMYVEKILSNVADMDTAFKHLEGMTFSYILYVLFKGAGQDELVEKYRPEAEEQLRRYPSILDKLPPTFKAVGKELLDADAE